jgi:dTDP-4-amino-4,6-dideoxygalactose transaminase
MRLFEWFYAIPHLNVDWGASEWAAVLGAPFNRPSSKRRKVERLEEAVKHLTGAAGALAFESGRAALYWILQRALCLEGAGGRRDVVLPALLCRSVLDAVRSADLNPVLCDVNENLALDRERFQAVWEPEKTLAVVVPHIYGWPSPVGKVHALVRSEGVVVIDDAAASLGGRQNGRPLGLHGDAGLYSFNQGKAAVAGWGGMLVLPGEGRFCEILENPPPLQPACPRRARAMFRHFLWLDCFHRFSGPLGKIMGSARARLGLPMKRSILSMDIMPHAMAGLQAGVGLAQLNRLEDLTRARRNNMEVLRGELAGIPELRILPLPAEATPTRFAVETLEHKVVRDLGGLKQENPLAVHLRSKGIEVRYAYLPLHRYGDVDYPDSEHLAMSDRLSERLLLLPFLPPLDRGALARIGRAMRSFFGR